MYYADENAGVVILNTGMIWSRGKAGYVNPVYAEKVERIDREDPVFETDGIRLEMALGFISGGYVLGIGEGENMSFLTGYDSTGVYFYNSEESRSEKKDMEIAKKVCAKKGNCFKIYSVSER